MYCAATMATYNSTLSPATCSAPRRKRMVLAAIIGRTNSDEK